ncbi:MAG: hypothetical protein R2932_07070 [Caldilineaceae bacterium]
MLESHQSCAFNGVNAVSGDYGMQLSADALVQRLFGGERDEQLQRRQHEFTEAVQTTKKTVFRGVSEGVDATKLSEAGWGIIFAYADPQLAAIQEALEPLLTLRQAQAGSLYRAFTGVDAYRAGETKSKFLERFKIGTGAVDPKKGVPYYLLLIGSPELIPFEFQYQLDVQFAVGRLDFDTLEEYDNYAKTVLAAETGQHALARKAAFFSVVNADDSATSTTDQYLVQPLAAELASTPNWSFTTHRGDAATRGQLETLLGGDQKPALLFTASHGIEFPAGHPQQERRQGALLCGDWPGPRQWRAPLKESFYFAGEHLSSSADPSGMIAFHFACFGGGTPQFDDFAGNSTALTQSSTARKATAARPFVANLPKRLLGHPNGGALAVVSHVDRAWSYSFRQNTTPQTTVFEGALKRLLRGQPLGWALEYFNARYGELAADLNNEINRLRWGNHFEAYQIAALWTENHDARNYVVLGDPAVRVAVAPLGRSLEPDSRPLPIPVTADGRPVEVPAADWAQTPASVRSVLAKALAQVSVLTTELERAAAAIPAGRAPVFRDGGRSSGNPIPSATTRGGQMRDGGALRGGSALRGGAMRGGAPRNVDEDDKPNP